MSEEQRRNQFRRSIMHTSSSAVIALRVLKCCRGTGKKKWRAWGKWWRAIGNSWLVSHYISNRKQLLRIDKSFFFFFNRTFIFNHLDMNKFNLLTQKCWHPFDNESPYYKSLVWKYVLSKTVGYVRTYKDYNNLSTTIALDLALSLCTDK